MTDKELMLSCGGDLVAYTLLKQLEEGESEDKTNAKSLKATLRKIERLLGLPVKF